ncbi:MAG: hypothetical protein LH616_11500 [Ilumatobacteraceae bacterium]|nr:hypothetical protein [Ilumatobacteraceae bacterium]
MPSTNKARGWRRLATLSAGQVEIIRTFESITNDGVEYPTSLNLAPDTDTTALVNAVNRVGLAEEWISEAKYAALDGIHSVEIPDLAIARELLREPLILESIYRLVVTLIRQGSAPLRWAHNPVIAALVLDAARRG